MPNRLRQTQPAFTVLVTLFAAAQTAAAQEQPGFVAKQGPLPESVMDSMKRFSWRAGCPVPLADLVYVEVPYWGFDGEPHQGELVVHQRAAHSIIEIFVELYTAKFPIERMRLIDHYEGSDDTSMADNNTSAFNCRSVAGRTDVFSNHSFGLAVDVNPKLNPYVTAKGKVMPPAGVAFKDRARAVPGLIVAGDACHKAFTSRGWIWGGAWKRAKDYQHFELRLDLNQQALRVRSRMQDPSPRQPD